MTTRDCPSGSAGKAKCRFLRMLRYGQAKRPRERGSKHQDQDELLVAAWRVARDPRLAKPGITSIIGDPPPRPDRDVERPRPQPTAQLHTTAICIHDQVRPALHAHAPRAQPNPPARCVPEALGHPGADLRPPDVAPSAEPPGARRACSSSEPARLYPPANATCAMGCDIGSIAQVQLAVVTVLPARPPERGEGGPHCVHQFR